MKTSDSISKISAALVKAQGELNAVSKDGNNPHFRSKYATLQNIVESTRDTLRKHGLAVVQTFSETDGSYISLNTTLLHESGEYISGTFSMRPSKADPQGLGSATTYARRYALSAILGIVADEDDDGNAASQPRTDRALETKYESRSASSELPWLNAVDKQGNFTKMGNKIVQRFIDEPDFTWIKVAEHYRINAAERKAIDAAVADLNSVGDKYGKGAQAVATAFNAEVEA
jgi:hypothetical protein